jgi:hypothetical protein
MLRVFCSARPPLPAPDVKFPFWVPVENRLVAMPMTTGFKPKFCVGFAVKSGLWFEQGAPITLGPAARTGMDVEHVSIRLFSSVSESIPVEATIGDEANWFQLWEVGCVISCR